MGKMNKDVLHWSGKKLKLEFFNLIYLIVVASVGHRMSSIRREDIKASTAY